MNTLKNTKKEKKYIKRNTKALQKNEDFLKNL